MAMDEREYNILFNKYHKRLVYFSRKLIGEMYCEDVVADVFAKVWKEGIKNGVLDVGAYLYKLVQNKCNDVLRGATRIRRQRMIKRDSNYPYQNVSSMPPDIKQHLSNGAISEEYADSKVIHTELLASIIDIVESMPAERKKMFYMIFIEDLSTSEIIAETGLSESTIRVQKMKIVKDLTMYGTKLINRPCWVNDGNKTLLSARFSKNKTK
jgi:RNA polymerase sigma-70 factor (ECF subfamily)